VRKNSNEIHPISAAARPNHDRQCSILDRNQAVSLLAI
jgi:hypothetical protein